MLYADRLPPGPWFAAPGSDQGYISLKNCALVLLLRSRVPKLYRTDAFKSNVSKLLMA